MTISARELNGLAKQLLDAKMQTDIPLEERAIDAGVQALLAMRARAENTEKKST